MSVGKYGISTTITGYESLIKIYDILFEKYKIKTIDLENSFGFVIKTNVIVYSDKMLKDKEVELLQRKLSKKWYTYKMNNRYMSESEYKKHEERIKEEKIQNEKYQKKMLKKKQEKENSDRGIYGIYFKGDLIYIGLTLNSFEKRFKQHKNNLENKSEELFLYKYLSNKDYHNNLTLRPLINIKDIKSANKLNERDIQMMELALITLYQPLCNVQGKLKDYKISKTLVL